MINLKVYASLSRQDSIDNVLRHNKFDLPDTTYCNINGVIYKSIVCSDTLKGCIRLPQLLRTTFQMALNDIITVTPVQVANTKLQSIKMNIKRFKQKNETEFIQEDMLIDDIIRYFKGYYLCEKQMLIFCKQDIYVINIMKGNGYIDQNTAIDIISLDHTLNLGSPKKIKSDIFDVNFNFETIGIGGLSIELKEIFKKALSLRALSPDMWSKLGIQPVKGVLLYGPPGCGKTLIARNISSLISPREPKIVNGPDILNKFVGQSEENMRNIFKDAMDDYTRNGNNSDLHVIIFDEIDAICKARSGSGTSAMNDNLVNQLLCILQGVNDKANNYFVIAMTNRRDLLDPALLRAGRLEVHIEIKLPDYNGRCEILRVHTDKIKMQGMLDKNFNVDELALITENFTGAELNAIICSAVSNSTHAMLSNGEKVDIAKIKLSNTDLIKAINSIQPMFGKDTTSIPILDIVSDVKYYDEIVNLINSTEKMLSIIVYGPPRSGKTVLMTKVANDLQFNFCKYVKGSDLMTVEKVHNIFNNAKLSSNSLIVLDDVETLLDYSDLGSIMFSSKMYHTILTNIKQYDANKMVVVVCCYKEYLFENVKPNFMHSYQI